MSVQSNHEAHARGKLAAAGVRADPARALKLFRDVYLTVASTPRLVDSSKRG